MIFALVVPIIENTTRFMPWGVWGGSADVVIHWEGWIIRDLLGLINWGVDVRDISQVE